MSVNGDPHVSEFQKGSKIELFFKHLNDFENVNKNYATMYNFSNITFKTKIYPKTQNSKLFCQIKKAFNYFPSFYFFF